MKFKTALNWMIHSGKKLKAPGFLGYWYWDAEKGEIIIVTKNNERLPMKDSDNWEFTLGFICCDEWEFYNGPDDPRDSKEYQEIHGRSLK